MSRWPDPPELSASFYKAHGLGNDYLVFEEGDAWRASPDAVSAVCDPHRGVGSDGIVALLADRSGGRFRLRMFNPDGSEFERSGNGLRVLAAYLAKLGEPSPYEVDVGGGQVTLTVNGRTRDGYDVSVDMGRARVGPGAVDMDPAALDGAGQLSGPNGEPLHVVPVWVGNPHLVVLTDEFAGDLTEERLNEIGPFLVAHPSLAHGANVQLARPMGRDACEALVWERGVGPTSASGTSACAVAVALSTLERIRAETVSVRMPGGTLFVSVTPALDVVLRGPVSEVYTGELTDGFLAGLGG